MFSQCRHVFTSIWRTPRLWRLGVSVLFGMGLSLFLSTRVEAAQSVVLVNRDQTLTVPLSELQAIANQEEPSEAVTAFFKDTGYYLPDLYPVLTGKTSYLNLDAVVSREFLLLQVNKTLGDPLGREDLDALDNTFQASISDDNAFSIIELLENYPRPVVRLDVHHLERLYEDVNLYVTRIAPVLSVADQLLPELICDCNAGTSENLTTVAPSGAIAPPAPLRAASSVYAEAVSALTALRSSAALPTPTPPPPTAAEKSTPVATKELVFTFGPLGRSVSIEELTTLAETGEPSRKLAALLKLGKVDPADLQHALNAPVKVNLSFLDRTLNTFLGEYLLFEVGQVVHTHSKTGNVQALRSTLVLSTAGDNEFTPLELLQNYPTAQIYVDGARLARYGRNIKRLQPADGVAEAELTLEDWLVHVQVSASEEVCSCDRDEHLTSESWTVTPDERASFLPVNWQPVPSHREDRGLIKVVWLAGTPYEMGYQHGQLLHNEIAELDKNVMPLLRMMGRGFGLSRLAGYRSYLDITEECRGLADATQDLGMTADACMVLAYGDVYQELFGYTLPNVLFWNGCSQFVAANDATPDGRLYHGSTVDNDNKPIDYIVNNPVVFVRQPVGGLPHIFVTYPGVLWPNSGLNVAGISLGLDTAHPSGPDEMELRGRSNVQIMANILENATSFTEARTILETEPRVRANLIMLTDGRSRQAGVFEFTGKHLGVRELQNNGVLYTTNHFVLDEMYERQPLPISDSSKLRLIRYQQLLEPDSASSVYGQIDAEAMVKILRDRVNPETMEASPLDVFDDNASPGGNGSLRQALYEPEALRFWIAAGPPPVPENPFVCFSLEELLVFPNAKPCEAPAIP